MLFVILQKKVYLVVENTLFAPLCFYSSNVFVESTVSILLPDLQ